MIVTVSLTMRTDRPLEEAEVAVTEGDEAAEVVAPGVEKVENPRRIRLGAETRPNVGTSQLLNLAVSTYHLSHLRQHGPRLSFQPLLSS